MKLTINATKLEKLVKADLLAKGLVASSIEFINKRTGVEAVVTVKDEDDEEESKVDTGLLEDGIKVVAPTVTKEELAVIADLK